MFLKRIELSGFKSFADRTELEFVRGITAVVGPNGSGREYLGRDPLGIRGTKREVLAWR